MARYYGNPKSYASTLTQKYTKSITIVVLIILAAALAYYFTPNAGIYLGFAGFALIAIFVSRAEVIVKLMGKNDRGSTGEWQIKKVLQTLSDEYIIFQNVPIRKRLDIDFVLVGPTGVYAIEVKSHGKYHEYKDGKDFIGQTLTEAMSLKEYMKKSGLSVYVEAVLVFSRAQVNYGFTPQRGVYVIGKDSLLTLLDRGRVANFDRVKLEELIKKLYTR